MDFTQPKVAPNKWDNVSTVLFGRGGRATKPWELFALIAWSIARAMVFAWLVFGPDSQMFAKLVVLVVAVMVWGVLELLSVNSLLAELKTRDAELDELIDSAQRDGTL